jgi:galactokinase
MTGAGFGGSVVALVDAAHVDSVLSAASETYRQRFGSTPHAFVAESLGGVRSVNG